MSEAIRGPEAAPGPDRRRINARPVGTDAGPDAGRCGNGPMRGPMPGRIGRSAYRCIESHTLCKRLTETGIGVRSS